MTKRIVLISLLIVCLGDVFAQEEDFLTWTGFSLSGELFDDVEFSIEPELRFFDNASRLGSWQTELALSTKLSKKISAGAFYRYKVELDNPAYNERVQRFGAFAKFRYKTGKLRWTYKAQLQQQYVNYYSSEDGSVAEMAHRHRIMVKYQRKKNFVNPSVGVEYNLALLPYEDRGTWKRRLYFSLEKDLSKKVTMDLSYRYQRSFNVDNPNKQHILFVGLEYEL